MHAAAHDRIWVRLSSLCAMALFLGTVSAALGNETKGELAPAAEIDRAATVPTHRQSNIVEVNVAGQTPIKIACFCLTADDRILVGGAGESGEIRVFDADGKSLDSWKMPINPEAIYARRTAPSSWPATARC